MWAPVLLEQCGWDSSEHNVHVSHGANLTHACHDSLGDFASTNHTHATSTFLDGQVFGAWVDYVISHYALSRNVVAVPN